LDWPEVVSRFRANVRGQVDPAEVPVLESHALSETGDVEALRWIVDFMRKDGEG
jgi:hypothetical protein